MRRTLILLAIVTSACGADVAPTATPPVEVAPEPAADPTPTEPTMPDPSTGDRVPPLGADAARAVGAAVNAFAAPLFARIAATPGNVACSPASIEAALALTAAGARGETATEMRTVLHLPEDEAIDQVGHALRTWDDPSRTTYTLRVANRLFGDDAYAFEQPYLDRVASAFGAPLERRDFGGAPEPQRAYINGWVAEHTRDRIRDLLPPGSIVSDTRLVLVNAIYLDATWAEPFERRATRPDAFRVDAATTAQVETMHRRFHARHGVIDGATVIELPYAGDELAMRFVLPPEGTAPEAWATEAHLSDATELARVEIDLSLPKFRVETPTIALGEALQAMGMRLAFDRAEADFTAIAAPPTPDDRLYVTEVFHKAFVRVDEQGTEAAAATAVVMARGGAAPSAPALAVRIDRPFLFVLRDLRTGAVLFLGRVSDPR